MAPQIAFQFQHWKQANWNIQSIINVFVECRWWLVQHLTRILNRFGSAPSFASWLLLLYWILCNSIHTYYVMVFLRNRGKQQCSIKNNLSILKARSLLVLLFIDSKWCENTFASFATPTLLPSSFSQSIWHLAHLAS